MFGVGQYLQHVVEATDAAAIFRGTSIRARQAHRVFKPRIGRQNLFCDDFMLPAIAEIVLVNELALRGRRYMRERETLFIQPLTSHIGKLRVWCSVKNGSGTRA